MLKRLRKWLNLSRYERERVTGEWKPDDAENLATFLETESGKKLRWLLWEECAERAFGTRDVSSFERGVTAGMCSMGQTIDDMAVREEKPEEPE